MMPNAHKINPDMIRMMDVVELHPAAMSWDIIFLTIITTAYIIPAIAVINPANDDNRRGTIENAVKLLSQSINSFLKLYPDLPACLGNWTHSTVAMFAVDLMTRPVTKG